MALIVDNLVAEVRKASVVVPGEWKDLAVKLNQCEEQLSKVEPAAVLDTMVECLQLPTHSLGVLAAL
jgi:hypothetical protein